MNKSFKNLIGFCIVAYLLFSLYSCIHTNIDSMDKTSVTPGVNIYLSANVTAYSITEIQAQISAFNQSLVNIARSQGVNSPRFYYHLSGQQVAVNRYILAPEEVKFSGILK